MKTIYNPAYKEIIKRLKKARLQAGLKQIDVAKAFKKPQSYVSKVEIGEQRLDALELQQFAKLYKIKLSWLLGTP